MASIYKKTMREALEQARDYRDTSDIEEVTEVEEGTGHLEYDEWLKQVKGIKKGAYGINSDEHAKYSEEWRAYVKGLFDKLPPIKTEESNLDEIVGGRGEMTISKDDQVMIIKTRDWQTYKAKGWAKREEVENESLELPATGAITSNSTSQEDDSEELTEIHWSNKGEPPAPKGMHKLRSGRDVPSSPKVDKIHKKVIAMTDRNDHSGARIELAKQVGDKQLAQVYSALELIHDKYSGVVGNKSIELRHKFEPVLNNQLDRKFGKYADILRDAL